MLIRIAAAAAASLMLLGTHDARAQAPALPAALDYANTAHWLCLPGRADACAADQTATTIPARGRPRVERFKRAERPKFDCFYVYPTVSLDAGGNSDAEIGPEDRNVAGQQFARFAGICRTYAPVYRQLTLARLRAFFAGVPMQADADLPYADVKAAWEHYLQHDNGGRGVLLIGHSQGASVLRRLIAEEIDAKPVQGRIIAAYLAGSSVAVPEGRDVGGDFKAMPLCRSRDQSGCLVTWSSFRADPGRSQASIFGVIAGRPGMSAACTNPAALAGGNATLRAYIASNAGASGTIAPLVWPAGASAPATPFLSAPGLLSARCEGSGPVGYLAVSTAASPGPAQPRDAGGDLMAGSMVVRDWGLHMVDMHLVMGDLIALAQSQARAWERKRRQR